MSDSELPFLALNRAIDVLGTQVAFAQICGVSQPSVSDWVRRIKRLPAEHVLKVEAATGVSRHDLRPDIYPRDETSFLSAVTHPAEAPAASCPPVAGAAPSASREGIGA